MSNINFTDPTNTLVSINDFTPGVFNPGPTENIYSSDAKPGSASKAVRCYAKQGVGLIPFPGYTTVYTKLAPSSTYMTLGSLLCQGSAPTPGNIPDQLFAAWSGTGAAYFFNLDCYNGTSDTIVYTHNQLGRLIWWANLSKSYTVTSSLGPSVFTCDPSSTNNTDPVWVVANGSTSNSGNVTPWTGTAFFASAFFTERFVALNGGLGSGALDSSDVQSMTNWTVGEFSPESANLFGAWGSFSTGETFIIFGGGGAVVISGDIQSPSSVITLPGVTGTGTAVGPAISSQTGLLYVTDFDGVWLWNGGNTSQKISGAVRDDQFMRGPVGAGVPGTGVNVACDSWSNLTFFANNWVFDSLTGAWWQCEDTSVNNFQVHAASAATGQVFYSSTANAGNGILTSLSVPIVMWDKKTYQNTWTWISNPMPFPGSLVTLQTVEICASNTTAYPATITVTPTSPPLQATFPNNNASQPVTFTIPANTSSYRQSQRVGYQDYNVCVQVAAAGDTTHTPGAPILHELNLTVDRRPAASP